MSDDYLAVIGGSREVLHLTIFWDYNDVLLMYNTNTNTDHSSFETIDEDDRQLETHQTVFE